MARSHFKLVYLLCLLTGDEFVCDSLTPETQAKYVQEMAQEGFLDQEGRHTDKVHDLGADVLNVYRRAVGQELLDL